MPAPAIELPQETVDAGVQRLCEELLEHLLDMGVAIRAVSATHGGEAGLAEGALNALQVMHDTAAPLACVRGTFADLKGILAEEANRWGCTYPRLADALDCSEPYIQQIVYRGRKVRAAWAG